MANMLAIGEPIPDVEAEASNGTRVRLHELQGQPLVLFFYPKSFTSGCTIETRRFAEYAPEIEELGARLLGVSIDTIEKQCDFAAETGASFPILADTGGRISKAFGVKRMLLPVAKRVTFVVDERGKVEKIFAMELQFAQHVDKVLEHLRSRRAA